MSFNIFKHNEMAEIDNVVAEYFQCFAGTENDLNHILSTFVDSEHKIKNFCDSRYIELSDTKSVIKNDGKEFYCTYSQYSKYKCEIWQSLSSYT